MENGFAHQVSLRNTELHAMKQVSFLQVGSEPSSCLWPFRRAASPGSLGGRVDHLFTRCFCRLEGSPSLALGALRGGETPQGGAWDWFEGSQGQPWGGGPGKPQLRQGRVHAERPSRQQASFVQNRATWEGEQSGLAEPQPGRRHALGVWVLPGQGSGLLAGIRGISHRRSRKEGTWGSPWMWAECWPCQGSNPLSEP